MRCRRQERTREKAQRAVTARHEGFSDLGMDGERTKKERMRAVAVENTMVMMEEEIIEFVKGSIIIITARSSTAALEYQGFSALWIPSFPLVFCGYFTAAFLLLRC